MNARQLAAERKADVLRHLRKASQRLARAVNDRNASDSLEGDGPLHWSFAIGAAQMCIWEALAKLGDRSLLDAWEGQMKAEREARIAAQATTNTTEERA